MFLTPPTTPHRVLIQVLTQVLLGLGAKNSPDGPADGGGSLI